MDSLINIGLMFAVLVGALVVAMAAVRLLDRLVFPGLSFEQALRESNVAVAIFLAALVLGIFLLAGRAVAAPLRLGPSTPLGTSSGQAIDHYDDSFRQWGRIHFGYAPDWRWFKAQGLTESGLHPEVCSAAGACGLMQLMPGTALAMGLVDRLDARQSIRAGIAYDRQLWGQWTAPRPLADRLKLTFASYNAGLGHVLTAQRHSGGSDLYVDIAPHLWREPREYVQRIGRWKDRFTPWGRP